MKNNPGPDQSGAVSSASATTSASASASAPASAPTTSSQIPCDALVASINDVIAILDAKGVNCYKSPNAERIFGWKPEQLVGHSAFDKVHPEDRAAVAAEFTTVLATSDGQARGECRYQKADGEYRWIEYDATNRLTDPNIAGVILSYRDITERRETLDSLQRSEQRFRSLFDQSAVGYILANSQNEIVEINQAGASMLGYEPWELVGVNGRDLIHPEDLEEQPIEHVTEQVLNKNVLPEIEHRFRRKSGEYVDVWAKVQPIQLEDARPSHMITFNEISARKAAERRAAALLKEKELLLREVHHRTKNNLATLSSMLHIQGLNSGNSEVHEALSQAADRLAVMMRVYEQLTYSESVQEVALPSVLHSVIDDLVASGSAARLVPKIEIAEIVVPVRLSVTLAMIVNELVMNVSKYAAASEGTSTHIQVHAVDEAHRDGSAPSTRDRGASERRGNLVLQVADSGPGFPPDVLAGERQGFGLMIVSALAEQHGGSMQLWNQDGGCVRVTLGLTE